MSKINWQNVLIIVALVAAGLGLVLPQTTANAPVASTQAFQCAPGAMCVQSGGKVVTFPDGSTLGVMSGATFTATDFTATSITVTNLISSVVSFVGATADLTGALTADSADITGTVAAGYVSATDITGTLATASQPNVTNLGTQTYLTATNAALTNVTGPFTTTDDIHAGTVYVDGYLRSSVGPVTSFDDFTALKNFTATQGVIINGHTFTETGPVTVTGLCTACYVLIYQP